MLILKYIILMHYRYPPPPPSYLYHYSMTILQFIVFHPSQFNTRVISLVALYADLQALIDYALRKNCFHLPSHYLANSV